MNVVVARAMWREMQKSTVQVGRQVDDLEAAERAILVLEVYAVTDPIEVGESVQLQCTIVNTRNDCRDRYSDQRSGRRRRRCPLDFGLSPLFFRESTSPFQQMASLRPADVVEGENGQDQINREIADKTIGPLDTDAVEGKYWINSTISISYRDMFGKAYILNDCLILPPKGQRSRHCRMVTDPKANQKPN